MTKAEIIADILAKSGASEIIDEKAWSEGSEGDCKGYQIIVLQQGEGAVDKKPVGLKVGFRIYVWKEGTADEEAFYHPASSEGKNQTDTDITGTTLEKIGKIYNHAGLRLRCQGAILKSAFDITNEDAGIVNHAERMELAIAAIGSVQMYLDTFMAYVATNTSVQTDGVATTDNDMQWIINSVWDTIALEKFGA